jgi:alkaline phosphatase D
VFRRKYQRLMDKPGFRDLRDRSTVLAIWDDHDYGENDAGIEYPAKELSRQHFLSFWGEPKDSPRWTTDGNYAAHVFGPEGQRVQVILLDTRWSRSPLVRLPERAEFGPYGRNNDPKTRVLGEAQWAWLEEQLKVPAQVRIIATSIQLLADEHNFEKWGNFPHEKARLLKLLETSSGVPIVVSGDRHSGEISRFDLPNGRRLYDITSSALNQGSGIPSAEPNTLRRGARIAEPHTGVIEIDWETGQVRMQLRRESGSVLVESSDRLRTMAGRENAAP